MNAKRKRTAECLQIFVPEGDRESKSIPVDLHDRWVVQLLELCALLFGGATAYGRGVGVWREKGTVHWDRVTVVEAWVDPRLRTLGRRLRELEQRLEEMRADLRQVAVGYILKGKKRFLFGGACRP
ncbi:MAG: hypothetical protein HY720_26580 [Planctomycetes bacterium]|nr:hypothetical protein [Planctomycetota bacterium]